MNKPGASSCSNTSSVQNPSSIPFSEALRAYKSAFLYYLQTQAAGAGAKSREKFAQLLCKFADPKGSGEFEALFTQIYEGVALSDAECSKNSLEGRFLAWLPTGK